MPPPRRASPGRRNHLLHIDRSVKVSDGQGGWTESWQLRADVWGLVEPVSATEALYGAQLTTALSSGVTIPWRGDLSVTDRIRLDPNRLLQVVSYQDPDGRQAQLRILCAEVQP